VGAFQEVWPFMTRGKSLVQIVEGAVVESAVVEGAVAEGAVAEGAVAEVAVVDISALLIRLARSC
jgi:hypothetical protein